MIYFYIYLAIVPVAVTILYGLNRYYKPVGDGTILLLGFVWPIPFLCILLDLIEIIIGRKI